MHKILLSLLLPFSKYTSEYGMEWYFVGIRNITKRMKIVLSLMSLLIQFLKEKKINENNCRNPIGLSKHHHFVHCLFNLVLNFRVWKAILLTHKL